MQLRRAPAASRRAACAAASRPCPRRVAVRATAAFEGCQAQLPAPIKVVGCGSCGVDYLASVAAFPQPDQKLRTDTLEVQGGGNCANALTAAARLGLSPTIVTKIGGDGLGDGIMTELQADGVDTRLLLREAQHSSPFTYIIVDRAGGTRTCIHTPGAAFDPAEMTPQLMAAALSGAALVYFDGRLTEAALLLARAARAASVPVLVEGERLRPGLQDLLAEADYVAMSAHFPQEWTGEACVGDALLEVAARLPRAKMLISTQGSRGSICLLRQQQRQGDASSSSSSSSSAQSLQEVIDQLFSAVSSSTASSAPVCVSSSGLPIQPARVAATPAAVALHRSGTSDAAAVAAAAQQAAQQAAALNADAGSTQAYGMQGAPTATARAAPPTGHQRGQVAPLVAQVIVASAAGLPAGAVADTTGAGDAFIGSVLYGITTGMQPQQMLQLGAAVAACKCTALGARPGLPRRQQLAAELLAS